MPRNEEVSFNSQMSQSAQRALDDPRLLYTDNYGGLNLETSAVNIPYADSPAMLNMEVSLSGRIRKRAGSVLRGTAEGYSDGYICIPLELPTGEWVIWEKIGTTLRGSILGSHLSNDSTTPLWTYSSIFSSASQNEKPHFVVTKEDAPRIIMVTKSTVPIEIESYMLRLVGDGDTTITYPGDWTLFFSTSYAYGIYGTTSVSLSSVTHLSGTTTFTFSSGIPSGQQITLVSPIFHWWAEAVRRTAAQVYSTSVRFNTSIQADANVAVPTEIRRGLYADYTSYSSGAPPCILMSDHTTVASALTYDTTPSSSTEYAWSNEEFTDGSGDYISFGTTFVTFGGISGAGTDPPTPIRFVRYNYLPFNGGSYAEGGDIGVYSPDGTAYTWHNDATNRTTSANRYWLLDTSRNRVASGSPTTLCAWARFDASVPFGIAHDYIVITNKEPNTSWVGNQATSTYYSPTSFGSFRPIYGLSEFCNYNTGVFPTIVALYQDRLVLSGISAFPNNLYLSAQGTESSYYKYQNFQIYMEDSTIETNPIEVSINGSDSITSVTDWFNSLFVFTDSSVKRVYSPNQVLTPTSKTQSDIATIGCPSTHAVAKTDRNVVFLSDSGVHKVAVLEQTGDYYVESISLKVREIFQEGQAYGANSWLNYNPVTSVLYVGISDGYDPYINQRLLVFFNEREAWSEFSLFTGYLPNTYGICFDGRVLIGVVDREDDTVTTKPTSNSITYLTEFNRSDLAIDLKQTVTVSQFNSGTFQVKGSRTATITFTVDGNQRVIRFSKDKVGVSNSNYGFKYIPVDSLFTLLVTYSQGASVRTLTGGTDFVNDVSRNGIHSTVYPWNTSDTITVKLRDEDGLSPVWVEVDKVEKTEDTDFTVTESSSTYLIDASTTVNSNSVVYAGFKYPAYHFTPTFFRQAYRTEKRTTHYIGYYSNRDFKEIYSASDANTSVSQDTGAVADQYVLRANVNVAFCYNDTRTGSTATDLYLGSNLIWDVSLFDVAHSPFQLYDVVRIVEPILGIGYNFSVCNYSFNSQSFELVGYSVETTNKGRNSRTWF